MCNRRLGILGLNTDYKAYKDAWREQGHYFGYPYCCVEEFCELGDFSEDQLMVSNKSGFVPCKECTKKVLSGVVSIEDLITNRICEEDFKIDNE